MSIFAKTPNSDNQDVSSDIYIAQSDFSATIETICSSEELLYDAVSDSIYNEDRKLKKKVTFGNVFTDGNDVIYKVGEEEGKKQFIELLPDDNTNPINEVRFFSNDSDYSSLNDRNDKIATFNRAGTTEENFDTYESEAKISSLHKNESDSLHFEDKKAQPKEEQEFSPKMDMKKQHGKNAYGSFYKENKAKISSNRQLEEESFVENFLNSIPILDFNQDAEGINDALFKMGPKNYLCQSAIKNEDRKQISSEHNKSKQPSLETLAIDDQITSGVLNLRISVFNEVKGRKDISFVRNGSLKQSNHKKSTNSFEKKASKSRSSLRIKNWQLKAEVDYLKKAYETHAATLQTKQQKIFALEEEIVLLKTKCEDQKGQNRKITDELLETRGNLEHMSIHYEILDRIYKLKTERQEEETLHLQNSGSGVVESMENLGLFVRTYQDRSDFISKAFSLLFRHLQKMYRYTLIPAFTITRHDTGSDSEILYGPSSHPLQVYFESKKTMIQAIQDLQLPLTKATFPSKECDDPISLLTDLATYLDNLNVLVAAQMKNLLQGAM